MYNVCLFRLTKWMSSVEPPVRVTTDRVKNPKRQEHMKKVNEKKKELKLKIEQENEPATSWNYLWGPSIFVAVLGLLYAGRKYLSKSPLPAKQVTALQSEAKTKESKFPDF